MKKAGMSVLECAGDSILHGSPGFRQGCHDLAQDQLSRHVPGGSQGSQYLMLKSRTLSPIVRFRAVAFGWCCVANAAAESPPTLLYGQRGRGGRRFHQGLHR
eukprot:evm.model.scf_1066.4 EVM.evm.TU.scf_1066.4   scf_1066:38232-38537(+)